MRPLPTLIHTMLRRWCPAVSPGAGKWGCGRRWLGLITKNWERKRFYRHVSVYESEEGEFGVKLDHRHLRTPLRQLFLLSSMPLAMIAAQEWVGQVGVVKPSLMHVTSMCNTVLDNPLQVNREHSIENLIAYLQSDTLRSRATGPEGLVSLQQAEWNPIIEWFNKRFGVSVDTYTSLLPTDVTPSTLSALTEFMRELNRWSFAGFEACVEASKSLILSCALFEGQLSPAQVAESARLEVRFQTSQWGEVEWQHGLEASDMEARLSAGLIMHCLCSDHLLCAS